FGWRYYKGALKEAAACGVPISFVSTQWESLLLRRPEAGVTIRTRDAVDRISPFGPIEAWWRAGWRWGSTPMLRHLQMLYPDPPAVVMVSNNEAPKIKWKDVESDPTYVSQFGYGRGEEFKRRVVGDALATRGRRLQQGFRQGLATETWKKHAIFIGFNAFGPMFIGRWPGWLEWSLYSPGRVVSEAIGWDGCSAPFYVNDWDASTDFTIFSPQIE